MDHITVIVLIHPAFSLVLAQLVGIGIINRTADGPTPIFPPWLSGGSLLVSCWFVHFLQEFPGIFWRRTVCVHWLPWVGGNGHIFWLFLDFFCFLHRKALLLSVGILVGIGEDHQFTLLIHVKKGWFTSALGLFETF